MSIFRPRDQQGSWGPQLRSPMPTPADRVNEGPLIQFCVNQTWLPAIITAFKLLTRPESWEGDAVDVQAAVMDAHTLIGMWNEECSGAPTPLEWGLQLEVTFGTFDVDVWDNFQREFIGTTPVDHYRLIITGDGVLSPQFTITSVNQETIEHVGGQWETTDFSDQFGGGHDVSYNLTQCVGPTVIDTNTTPFSIGPTEIKVLNVACGNPDITYFVDIFISGPILCTEA